MDLGSMRDGVWLRAATDAFAAFLQSAVVQAEAAANGETLTAAAVRNAHRAADAFMASVEARPRAEDATNRLVRERDERLQRGRFVLREEATTEGATVWVFVRYMPEGEVLLRPEGEEYDVRENQARDSALPIISVHRRRDGLRVDPTIVLPAHLDNCVYVDLADARPTADEVRASHDEAARRLASPAAGETA